MKVDNKMKKLFLTFALQAFTVNAAMAAASDPLYPKQWGLENKGQVILKSTSDLEREEVEGIPGLDINWVDISDKESTKKEVIVAVIDSGIDLEHPDLQGRIWYNETLCKDAPNKAILACHGRNFLDNNVILTDDIGHGTHVAGIIAANRDSQGIAGAADARVKIMPLKVMSSQVSGFTYKNRVVTDIIADSINFAVKNGADVINLSLGWPKLIDLEPVKKAFAYAEENNVTIVAASGNNNKDLPTFPCSYENVICVGAMGNRGEITEFSNHGAKVDIVAPGESIISTYPKNVESRVLRIKNYETKRGSSQAAPFVSAAIANLKLLKPEITNDEVRRLLFKTSKKVFNESEARFVKDGMLDMKALLEEASQTSSAFVIPQLKELTEVNFKVVDQKFSFDLGLKNLAEETQSHTTVCLEADSLTLLFDQNCFAIENLAGRATTKIQASGRLLNLVRDSHILINVKIDGRNYSSSVVFSRDISDDESLKSFSLGKLNFSELGVISGERKLSRLGRIIDKHSLVGFPEYYFVEAKKQVADKTVLSLITQQAESAEFVVKELSLPRINRLLSIHRKDINLDGKLDYLVYALSQKRDELLFFVFDENLNPLFGDHSLWKMTLSTFEGLPIDGNQEKFEWVKIEHPTLKTILVPSIYRSYTMPEADNSKRIADRVVTVMPHQYYLNPVIKSDKVEIELRVIDSAEKMKNLRRRLGIAGNHDVKTLSLLSPFPQSEEESNKGEMRSLVLLDDNGEVEFYEVALSVEGTQFDRIQKLYTDKRLNQAILYPVTDLRSGKITSEAVFTSLLNRATAEFIVKKEGEVVDQPHALESWENPILGLLNVFDDEGSKKYLLENRYTVSVVDEWGAKKELPIYRDSSFPGQDFSETLSVISSHGRPGVFVNSTLIYGNRLYSMIDTEYQGFIRPLALSISIPANCVPLSPEILEKKGEYYYPFVCSESSSEVVLKFLSLSHL